MLKHNVVWFKTHFGVLQAGVCALVTISLSCFALADAPRLKQLGKKQTVKAKAKPIDLKGKIIFTRGQDVYAINPDGSREIHVMQSPKGYGNFAALSPDGRKALFTNAYHIYSFNLDGTGRETIFDWNGGFGGFITRPTFNAYGSQIIFGAGGFPSGGMFSELYTVSLPDKQAKQLTNDRPGGVSDENNQQPSFSRDGKKIAFLSGGWRTDQESGENMELFVMNADGTRRTRLTKNQSWEEQPSFSPDGKKIVFVRHTYTTISNLPIHTSDIYIMNSDGSREIRLTQNIAWTTSGLRFHELHHMNLAAHTPVFSCKSGQIAFTQDAVYVIDMRFNDYRPRRLTDGTALQWM